VEGQEWGELAMRSYSEREARGRRQDSGLRLGKNSGENLALGAEASASCQLVPHTGWAEEIGFFLQKPVFWVRLCNMVYKAPCE
jgi:hypothetical protein